MYSNLIKGYINYREIYLQMSKINLEDHWMVNFMPSYVQELTYLKYKDLKANTKPYGSDGMNGNGYNIKEKGMPDIISYCNFVMSDDVITTTRQKYTWLDAFAFVGGNIDMLLLLVSLVVWFNNYGLSQYQQYYLSEKERLSKNGESLSNEC